MSRWSWVVFTMFAGCGVTVYDHGSDFYTTGGITLVYADWIVPEDKSWERDSYECQYQAREAVPALIRVPGRRQALAEQCLALRGYIRR